METDLIGRLIEITAYSAVIFLAVLLFRRLFQKWLSPQLRYLLWFLVVLRLVVPVTFESGIHLVTLPGEEAAAAVASLDPLPVSSAETSGVRPGGTQTTGSSGGAAAPAAFEALTPEAKRREPLTLPQWLLVGWGAGALSMLAWHAVMTARLARRLRAFGRTPGDTVLRLNERLRASLAIRARLPVVAAPGISSPALTASLRPKLLLPERLAFGGEKEEIAFSLLHELMHYRRGDHLVCLAALLLRAVWWFNPVAWLLPQFLRTDMESACDAAVVRTMDKREKLRYANLLLELGQGE